MLTDALAPGAASGMERALARLAAIERHLGVLVAEATSQAPPVVTEEPVPIAFAVDNQAVYQVAEQLRVRSLRVWVTLAGLYTLQRGNDTSIRFLANPNVPTEVFSGEDQTLTLARGQTITIVPATNIAGALWYCLMFAVPGTNAFVGQPR